VFPGAITIRDTDLYLQGNKFVYNVNNPNSLSINKSRKYDNIDQKRGRGCLVTCKVAADGMAVHRISVGARMWWEASANPRPLYPWERDSVPSVQEIGWAL
jgi:expansin (peptidoglycan-binding protein)